MEHVNAQKLQLQQISDQLLAEGAGTWIEIKCCFLCLIEGSNRAPLGFEIQLFSGLVIHLIKNVLINYPLIQPNSNSFVFTVN